MSVRILLGDDHKLFLEGISALLQKEPGFEVIAKATDGNEATRLAREQEPDIVLLDLSMPGMSGIEATRLITAERPTAKVLCLSMYDDRAFVMGALDAGASGYILKDSAKHELLDAIRTVMSGRVYLCSAVAGMVVEATERHRAPQGVDLLTQRERQIVTRLTDGESTREIAQQLHLSVKTVGTHRSHIMEKLGINSIAELTKFAIREGLTSAD